jgi:hypothetical protein
LYFAVRSSTSPAMANVSKSEWMSVCVNLCLWKKLAQGKTRWQWGQLIFCRQLAQEFHIVLSSLSSGV